jgi:hypothetical protein
VRSTTAPYTESRLTRSVANERVGFPVVEQLYCIMIGNYLYFLQVYVRFNFNYLFIVLIRYPVKTIFSYCKQYMFPGKYS